MVTDLGRTVNLYRTNTCFAWWRFLPFSYKHKWHGVMPEEVRKCGWRIFSLSNSWTDFELPYILEHTVELKICLLYFWMWFRRSVYKVLMEVKHTKCFFFKTLSSYDKLWSFICIGKKHKMQFNTMNAKVWHSHSQKISFMILNICF